MKEKILKVIAVAVLLIFTAFIYTCNFVPEAYNILPPVFLEE